MPSSYAHLRFGREALQLLDEKLRRRIRHHGEIFDMGIHGPDIFFYYSPVFRIGAGRLGSTFHRESGITFFTRAAAQLRSHPSDIGTAYLYGVLAHYCLDSVCHPLIVNLSEDGNFGHTEIETEFDRYLLEMDGRRPAPCIDLSGHMHLTRGDCFTVAAFYPPVRPAAVDKSVRNMAKITHFLSSRKRKKVSRIMRFGGRTAMEMVMHNSPNERCSHLDEQLLELYREALQRYGVCAAQLQDHLENGTPLGDAFDDTFG